MEFNDFELIYMAKEKNEDAIKCLYKKYKPLLSKKAFEYYSVSKNKGVEFNDLLQEAMIGFEEAIYSFDPNSDILFYTFVNVCVDRQLKTAIAKLNRAKHRLLNEAISLDYTYEDDFSISNYVKEDKGNPEDLLIEGHNTELGAYKGVMISKENAAKDKFKIDLLNMLNNNK